MPPGTVGAVTTTTPLDAVVARPLLRGWLHFICFFLAIPTGAVVIAIASSSTARIGAAVYATALVALFGVSGFYHRLRWSPKWRLRMKRLDHSTIFVMIAASYTPICLVVLDGWTAVAMLTVAWVGAAVGAVLAWVPGSRSRVACSALYIVLGWAVLLAGPQLVAALRFDQLVLIGAGGLLFTGGAITLALHRPDPIPHIFGYHEVWHVLVTCAVVCQLIAIASLVSSAPSA